MKPFTVIASLSLLLLVALILAGRNSAAATSSTSAICSPSKTTIDEASGYPEIQASASEGHLWVMLLTRDGNIGAGARVRIIWKMTDGRGDIKLLAVNEQGVQVRPTWGPISRRGRVGLGSVFSLVLQQLKTDWRRLSMVMMRPTGSDWKRPGQEWGTEFIFPQAGCWRIFVSRWLVEADEPVTAEIDIDVKP
ncbi:MAG: hypothetical protein AB1649_24440 [Chloroflexota bacterium]